MDQDVINLAKAIRQRESGGNFNAVGDAGTSKGGYQWQPGTWKEHSKKILGSDTAEMTPDNQNAVAYGMIKTWKDQGLNPAQIAAKWNSGQSSGWENKIGTTTINGKKIPYNVPAYVKEVTDTYQRFKTESAPKPTVPTISPSQQADQAGADQTGAWFKSQTTDSPITSGLKSLGNVIPSAFHFAKGALNMVNPVEIAKNIGKIKDEFGALSQESGGAFNALKATAKEIPMETAKTAKGFIPEAIRDVSSAAYAGATGSNRFGTVDENLQNAQRMLVNDPFGQVAPVLLGARGLAGKADALASKSAMVEYVEKPFETKTIPKPTTKYADAFDNAMTKTSGAVTRPVSAAFGKAGSVVGSAMGQVTGLNPDTIRQIKETPSAFTKEAKATAGDRATLGQEVQSSLAKKAQTLTDVGKEYNPIRESKTLVNVKDNFVSNTIKETAGVDIVGGKVKTKGSATIRDATEVRALQNLLDLWDPIFKKKQLTPTEYLNFRTDLSNLSKFERQVGKSKPLESVAQIMRGKLNTEYRPQLKGLKALDDQFGAQTAELKTLSKGMVDRNGNLSDAAINRIANATGKGKDMLLERLEKTAPGITQKIKILKAIEDIEAASGFKVGVYKKVLPTLGGFAAGGIVGAIVADILASPQIVVPILRKYGVLKNSKVIKAVGNTLRESAQIVNNPGEKLSPYFQKDVKDIKVKAGLGIEDVSKRPGAFNSKKLSTTDDGLVATGRYNDSMTTQTSFKQIVKDKIEYNRKPTELEDIHYNVPQKLIPETENLPSFNMKDLGMKDITDYFNKEVPQHFVLETPSGKVLVNTEGYQYVRYAARVPKPGQVSETLMNRPMPKETKATKEYDTYLKKEYKGLEKSQKDAEIIAESLMEKEGKIWDALGIKSGSQLDGNLVLKNRYMREVEKIMPRYITADALAILEDNNYHSLVEVINDAKRKYPKAFTKTK